MADIQTNTTKKSRGVKRLIKKSTRVDLTPMVDLGFLLITFFVFTSAISKPKVIDLVNPIDSSDHMPVCESCVLTVILDKDDKIDYYEGMPGNNPVVKETAFTVDGLRKVLLDKRAAVKSVKGTADDMVLIIKPMEESLYKNFVDILDEVSINGVHHYFIDEVNDTDKKLLLQIKHD
jgi:biopolymer transport protein ExbD